MTGEERWKKLVRALKESAEEDLTRCVKTWEEDLGTVSMICHDLLLIMGSPGDLRDMDLELRSLMDQKLRVLKTALVNLAAFGRDVASILDDAMAVPGAPSKDNPVINLLRKLGENGKETADVVHLDLDKEHCGDSRCAACNLRRDLVDSIRKNLEDVDREVN